MRCMFKQILLWPSLQDQWTNNSVRWRRLLMRIFQAVSALAKSEPNAQLGRKFPTRLSIFVRRHHTGYLKTKYLGNSGKYSPDQVNSDGQISTLMYYKSNNWDRATIPIKHNSLLLSYSSTLGYAIICQYMDKKLKLHVNAVSTINTLHMSNALLW